MFKAICKTICKTIYEETDEAIYEVLCITIHKEEINPRPTNDVSLDVWSHSPTLIR